VGRAGRSGTPAGGGAATLSGYLQERERDCIGHVLARHGGHIARTADSLGISRKNLREKMKKLGIEARATDAECDLPVTENPCRRLLRLLPHHCSR